jgi:tetratricopeptide (TPR) repeat protein
MRAVAAALALLALATSATAQPPLETARTAFARYHEDLSQLEVARDALQSATEREPGAETLSALARAWFLLGEFRARSERERLADYERGREAGRRAVAAAPRSEQAHVWYALNTARLAGTRGIMRAASLLSTIREEAATILALNPGSVEGNTLAGGLAAELPAMLGGDRSRAEGYFKRALESDPRRTGPRVELARLYIATRRYTDAQRELQHVLDETAPSDLPYWTLADVPNARTLLASIAPQTQPRESP